MTLPEGGRYRLEVNTARRINSSGAQGGIPGIVYEYRVRHGKGEETVELDLDRFFMSPFGAVSMSLQWVPLGEFELPAGEVTVELSNKERNRNEHVYIVADAVRWTRVRE